MKLSSWFAALVCAFGLVAAGNALAARKTQNEYPNATRSEPRAEMSSADQRDLGKAADYVNEGKDDKAQEYVTKALSRKRSSPYAQSFAHQLQGQIYYDQDKMPEAIAEYRKAIEINGLPNAQHFQVLYIIAQLELQEEDYEGALATVAEWEKLTGTQTADELALKANAYYRLDQYQAAIDAMSKAISMSDKPSDSWSQILMASYFELGQYDQAAALVQQQLAKDPKNMKLINQLATVYIQADQMDKAAAIMTKAKDEGLITSGADYVQLAKLYASADKNKEAAAVMQEGFAKGLIEGNYDNYKLYGDICMQADNDACAIEAYTKASPTAPDGNVDYQLGYALYYADRSQEAIDALNRAITKGKLRQEGEAYLLRGDAENDLDRMSAAVADWQKAAGYPSTKAMAEQRIRTVKGGARISRPKK
ncbi:tetratricopeptide repeat protein [Dokdonella sp.]|uniref:tetratricopeptide repeat protein n=1 Tax=Dokdonella sp. TaxID=2291710 RepID=UPI0031C56B8A|nr:tetratricopeptide repeat protein [Dokdonella sp.]